MWTRAAICLKNSIVATRTKGLAGDSSAENEMKFMEFAFLKATIECRWKEGGRKGRSSWLVAWDRATGVEGVMFFRVDAPGRSSISHDHSTAFRWLAMSDGDQWCWGVSKDANEWLFTAPGDLPKRRFTTWTFG